MNNRPAPTDGQFTIPVACAAGEAVLLWLGRDEVLNIAPATPLVAGEAHPDPRRRQPSLPLVAKTYFPPATGILLVRRNDDHFDAQLVRVDDAGCATPVGDESGQPEHGAGKPLHVRHPETIGGHHFQGFVGPERRRGLFQRLLEGIVGILSGRSIERHKSPPGRIAKPVVRLDVVIPGHGDHASAAPGAQQPQTGGGSQ